MNLDSERFRPDAVLLARAELARRKLPLHPLPNICSNCKEELEDDAQFCPECRTPIVAAHKTETEVACPDCAKMVSVNYKFCKYCAAEILPPPQIITAQTAASTKNLTNAESKLKGPAIAIIINAAIGLVTSLYGLMSMGDRPIYFQSDRAGLRVAQTFAVLLLFGHAFCIYSALQMMKARKHGSAITSAIIAIVSGLQTCIGLPIGIWALVVLIKPEIKSAFVGNNLE